MTRAVVEGDASLGNQVNCVAYLVFEARHQMRGVESTWHADALEREIEAAVDVQPRCRTPAGQYRQIDSAVGRRRITRPAMEAPGDGHIQRSAFDEPVFRIRPEKSDAVVDGHAPFEIEPRG